MACCSLRHQVSRFVWGLVALVKRPWCQVGQHCDVPSLPTGFCCLRFQVRRNARGQARLRREVGRDSVGPGPTSSTTSCAVTRTVSTRVLPSAGAFPELFRHLCRGRFHASFCADLRWRPLPWQQVLGSLPSLPGDEESQPLPVVARLHVSHSSETPRKDDPNAKMLLLLGEVGGIDEYDLIDVRPSSLSLSERMCHTLVVGNVRP